MASNTTMHWTHGSPPHTFSATHTGDAVDSSLAPDTVAVHAWATPAGRPRAHRTLNAPLYLTSQWEGASLAELARLFGDDPDRGFYTRFGHPTLRLAEQKLAALEGAEDALVFSSGMGAVSAALLATLRAGDHVVAHRAIFAQTVLFLEHLRDTMGIALDFVDATEPARVEAALRPGTRLLYLETPSNPGIDVLDVRRLATLAHRVSALVMVDSTFAGPMLQQPIALGADLSLQSASKSLAGHADVMAGVVAGGAALVRQVRAMRVLTGAVLDPHACWLLLRGLQTLPLRVRAQCETAAAVARLLGDHPAVTHLRYPFHDAHPACDVARAQMLAGGGMLSFALAGGLAATRRFVDALEWIPLASSLGSVHTTLEVPEELDFADAQLGDSARAYALPPGLIRFSVGTEDAGDVLRDVARGLEAAAALAGVPA